MNDKCENLVSFYENLLKNRDRILFFVNNINKNNIKDILPVVAECKILISEINNIIEGEYYKIRKHYEKFYLIFSDFYKLKNLSLPNFGDIEIPEKPKEGDWNLVFIDPRIIRNEVEFFNEVGFNDFWRRYERGVTVNTRPQRIEDEESYAIWIKDVNDSIEDDEMMKSNNITISYRNIMDKDFLNPRNGIPYLLDDFMSIGEFILIYMENRYRGNTIEKTGWFKSCCLDSQSNVVSAGWSGSGITIDFRMIIDSSDGVFRVVVSKDSIKKHE